MNNRLEALKNIGPVSAKWLQTAGISSREELEKVGVVEAFRRVEDLGLYSLAKLGLCP